MKIFIAADMEGVVGVTHGIQCAPGQSDYERFRRLMTAEVNAAIEGALEAGATEILVNDSHSTMRNIVIEELHPAASLISGASKLMCHLEGLDESFDGIFFTGYHQGEGRGDGVANHTFMGGTIRRVTLNGVVVDEMLMNAYVAGCFGVPVVLVAGDDRVCADAESALSGVKTVPVKAAIDRLAALSYSVETVRRRIREAAREAAGMIGSNGPQPLRLDGRARISVEFGVTTSAHMCELFPGVERTGPYEIALEHDSLVAAFRHFLGLSIFARAVQRGVFET